MKINRKDLALMRSEGREYCREYGRDGHHLERAVDKEIAAQHREERERDDPCPKHLLARERANDRERELTDAEAGTADAGTARDPGAPGA